MEYNMDVEQTSDILGRSDTTISAAKPQMNFDPNTLRVGQKLNSKLVDILRRGATSELGTFQVLIVYMFLSESGTGPYEGRPVRQLQHRAHQHGRQRLCGPALRPVSVRRPHVGHRHHHPGQRHQSAHRDLHGRGGRLKGGGVPCLNRSSLTLASRPMRSKTRTAP